jgi:hypothetical protein
MEGRFPSNPTWFFRTGTAIAIGLLSYRSKSWTENICGRRATKNGISAMEITELDTKVEPQRHRVLVAGGTPSDNSLVCR